MRHAAAAVLFLFALIRAASAADAGAALPERARQLLEYQSFLRSDRDGGVRFAVTASRDLQGTPLAELAVRLAMFYEPAGLSAVNVGEGEARRLLANEAELSPELRDILRRFVARSLAASGRREEALELHKRRGLATSLLLAGPFYGRKAAGFDSLRLPEAGAVVERDVAASPPTPEQFREWARKPPWRPVPENSSFPFVMPWRWTERSGADGAMVLFSGLEMGAADNNASFHIHSGTSWRLYVDGALAAEVDKNNQEAPSEHMVLFPLTAGAHSVFLQLFPPRAGIEPKGVRAALRLESSAAFSWNRDAAGPAGVRPANLRREARPLRFIRDLRAVMNDSPALMAAYALACLQQDMFDQASWWAEAAARKEPDNIHLRLFAGITTSMNPLLPGERRRDIASAWFRGALAASPDLIPALLYLARTASGSGHAREAADFLARAHAVNPGSLDVLLARAEWASRFASGAAARTAWDECGRAFPNSAAVQIAIASMPHDGFLDMERRLAACRAAVEAGPYNSDAHLKLAEALADSGNGQEAEYALRTALELFAGDVGIMVRISEVYDRLGLYSEAKRVLSDAVRIAPSDGGLWRRLGDVSMEAEDRDGAIRFWKVSLQADPGQFQLSDMLDSLSGLPDRLYNEGEYDAIAMTAAASENKYPGDVVRLLDRAVVRFAANGSHRRLTHEIDMANTRAGGESLTGVGGGGELLTARIVFPNGNTLEPEPYPGQEGLRLPVIMPRAAREVRMLESVPAGADAAAIKPWFFQDPSGRMPLAISEYVVRTPRNFPLVYVVKNLGRSIDFEFTREEDEDVYRWTANLSPPNHEPDAVHVSERVPSVEIGIKTTWEDVVFRELRKFEGRLTPSMRMRSLLASLYRIGEEDRADPEQAARAIYRFVCDNIDPTPAGDTAAHIQVDNMGDRRLLLLALLRAAGMDAHPAAARPRTAFLHPPAWELPNPDIFTVPMVRLEVPGGRTYWLDVRFDALPFGRTADDLSGATVLSLMPSGPLFETLSSLPADESTVLMERMIQLPAKGGALSVSGRSLLRGVQGLARGQALANADAEGKRRLILLALRDIFPDAVLERFDILRHDEDESSSLERYDITSRSAAEDRPGGGGAVSISMIPPAVISTETRNMIRRQTTCHIRTVHMAEDRNIFNLPPDAEFSRLPDPAHIPSRFGVYQLRVIPHGGNSLEIVRNYHIPAQRIPPWEWGGFLSFLKQVELAERQWVEYRYLK